MTNLSKLKSSPIPLVLAAVGLMLPVAISGAQSPTPVPVLVELFTSEGCSSCPPADALLQELDRSQPTAGAQVIALSEHVDYWDHLGWRDPYSSEIFSDWQNEYASHFGINTVYTPQMVVDGFSQFAGNDQGAAETAIQQAAVKPRATVRLADLRCASRATLHAHIEVDALPNSLPTRAEVFLVAALDHAQSQVLRGENEGHRLNHVAVVLRLIKLGSTERNKAFSQEAELELDPTRDLSRLRVIAFVQEPGSGRVLGVAMQPLSR